MIKLGACEITGVFGPMASGKTHLIEQWLKNENRFVRFDVTGESCDDPSIEHIWANDGGPLKLYYRLKDTPENRRSTGGPHFFRIAYHPGPYLEDDFYHVVRVLWRTPAYKTVVIDEMHEVCSVSSTPGYVQTMLRYARHNHLAVIGASQRIADVSKLFTAGCRRVVLFWTQEARDLLAISDRWGSETSRAVRDLRPLIYNDVTKNVTQVPQCVVCPKSGDPYIYDFSNQQEVTLRSKAKSTGAVSDNPQYVDDENGHQRASNQDIHVPQGEENDTSGN